MKKLNEIADHIADLLSGKKSRNAAQQNKDADQDSEPDEDDAPKAPSKAQKFQKSFRKATGGQNEPV